MKPSSKKIHKKVGQFPVIVHEDETGGYWVECPVIEGCVSQGETVEEALKMIQEAIELSLEDIPKRKQAKIAKQHVSLHMIQT